jgi:guanylate kinase
VLVRAPSPDVQEQRLRSRGDSEEHIQRRLALGKQEEADGLALACCVVINDDLERAVSELEGIVEDARRQGCSRS